MQHATVVVRPAAALRLRAFQQLTNPGITAFVGLSAAAGYIVSARTTADPVSLTLVVIATMAMSGGAAAFNHISERHLDARMRRTRRRPLPAGPNGVRAATNFAWALTAFGAALAIATLPALTFVLLAACHVTYVYVYTPLKLKSEWCTLVGAIPGALPVLAGSAAAGATADVAALALTGVLFAWQIPHFYAIGWRTRDDYAAAGFRMMTVRDESGAHTAATALGFAIAMQVCTVLLTRAIGASLIAAVCAHAAGTAYIVAALWFLQRRDQTRAGWLFVVSLVSLPVILAALILSTLTAAP